MTNKKDKQKYAVTVGPEKYTLACDPNKFNLHIANLKIPRIVIIKQHDLEWRLKALEKAGAQDITENIIIENGFVRYPAEFRVNFKATDEEYKTYKKIIRN